jgi:tRNA-splicing ligase RtcB (3'-phosphate/5'-hydroxy nucleic acid ligase)
MYISKGHYYVKNLFTQMNNYKINYDHDEHDHGINIIKDKQRKMKNKISGRDIIKIGFPQNNSINIALGIITRHYKKEPKDAILLKAKSVLLSPDSFKGDHKWGKLADYLIEPIKLEQHKLQTACVPCEIIGENEIDETAKRQMFDALKLPISIKGALMPDAHGGYGLPIGGVLATDNAIIPYGVGVDIGCRMQLSITELPDSYFQGREDKLMSILDKNTKFGMSETHKNKSDHEVLDSKFFWESPLLKGLHEKAYKQLGTSGGGNHFVEFGIVEFSEPYNKIPPGKYLGILSHSGSRSLGANIAKHYTKIASKQCPLPNQVQHLAWLDMNKQEGIEYWLAMNLAGDYAQACHDDIHQRLLKDLGVRCISRLGNHHNFAWKEVHDSREMIVHRKGATPAHEGEVGIIPGSMTAPGYIVRGKGNSLSLQSASHGAGRKYNRALCKNMFTQSEMKKILSDHNVSLIGGSIDEAPMAYKDINKVMSLQHEFVDVLGTFSPRLVKMDK